MADPFQTSEEWAPFYFECGPFHRLVTERRQWLDICMRFRGRDLATAKQWHLLNKTELVPNFGFNPEHTGPETLAEYAEENGMVL